MKFRFPFSALFALLIIVTLYGCGSSFVNNDASKHREMIAASRLNNDAVVSLDTVFYRGEAHSILKTTGLSLAPFYHFYTLTGEPAIDVLPYSAEGKATTHNEYIFLGTNKGMKAYTSFSFSTKGIVETVINNNLLSTTALRSIDVGNFVNKNPRPPKFNPANLKIRREMAKEVKINQGYGEIYQGETMIAKFTTASERNDKMIQTKSIFTINFLNGTKCASVSLSPDKSERKKDKYMESKTEFDGKIHRLTIDDENTNWEIDAFKQAVKYLINLGYL